MKTDISHEKNKAIESKLSQIKVLVMDSSKGSGALIKEIFSELGFTNVTIANDGFEGVHILKEKSSDLIFTDKELKVIWNIENSRSIANAQIGDILPLSGVLFAQRLRQSPNSPNPYMPVIMLLNNITGQEVLEARDSGVNEIITRPVNAEDFCSRIRAIIEHPRLFISSDLYKGPCRRRKSVATNFTQERRIKRQKVAKIHSL